MQRSNDTAVAIEVSGLKKQFRAKQKEPGLAGSIQAFARPQYRTTDAVKGTDFVVDSGELVAFIGPNGAGKSTTIKMLTGILHPTEGTASVLGLTPWLQRQSLAYNIASVFGQRSQLWSHLPPIDAFHLLAKIYEISGRQFKIRSEMLIDLFEIGRLVQTPVRKLSLGERMRCEIAASLLHQPKIVFLDEPTIGLDVIAKSTIRDLLRRMNREEGVTIFLTSHDAGDIEQVCRRVMIINHGALVLDAPVAQLRRDYLKTKIINLALQDKIAEFQIPGATVLQQSDYGVTLQVDTERQPIEMVISYLVSHFRVHDITIEDPPLEEIIGQIYAQGADSGRAES